MDSITALLATILTNFTMRMSEKNGKPRKNVQKAAISEEDERGCWYFVILFAVAFGLSYFFITITDARSPFAILSIIFLCSALCVGVSFWFLFWNSSDKDEDATQLPNNTDKRAVSKK